MALALFFDILTSYKVIRLFVTTTKLKSSPKQNENNRIFCDFVNWNLTSSAFFCFRNRRVRSVGETWSARHDLVGCTATERISLLYAHMKMIRVIWDLQRSGEVQREGDLGLLALHLELLPDHEIALVVEDHQVTEVIKEHVKIGEF